MRSTASARFVAVSILSSIALSACGDEPTGMQPPPAVVSVVVTPSGATLKSIGETLQLSASARDATGTTISGKTFTWSSSSENSVTVSSSGLVTAVAVGSAIVTATSDGVDGTARVFVALLPSPP
jgi:uncharacterized protein YjdB